jgi:hypothetical protein
MTLRMTFKNDFKNDIKNGIQNDIENDSKDKNVLQYKHLPRVSPVYSLRVQLTEGIGPIIIGRLVE